MNMVHGIVTGKRTIEDARETSSQITVAYNLVVLIRPWQHLRGRVLRGPDASYGLARTVLCGRCTWPEGG